ncbi:MAG: RNA polymerase sigma factor [Candidatus Rifleibacteriota bacterium]
MQNNNKHRLDNSPNISNKSDDDLMKAIKDGNKNAFKTLFNRHIDSIARFCAVKTANSHEASDIAQEIFVKVWKSADSYKPDNNFKSWIFTIARRHIIDRHRKKKLNQIPMESELISKKIDQQNTTIQTDHCPEIDFLKNLSEQNREIIALRIIENLSYKEIAKLTGITPLNLRQIVFRSLKKIQKEVKSDELSKTSDLD